MVAYEPEVAVPFHERIVGAEVRHPQEALPAQLNGVRHKVEHGNPDRHLDEHGQAATQWRHAILAVFGHHCLLLLHLVFRLVVLLRSLVELRLEHTHLRRTHIALLHHRVGDDLQQHGDENEYHTHVEAPVGKPCEYRHEEPTVDDAEQWPAQIDDALHVKFLVEGAFLLHMLQCVEVIGAIVELKL